MKILYLISIIFFLSIAGCQDKVKEAENLLYISDALCQAGENEKALRAINDSLKLNPNEPKALATKGIILTRLKRYEEGAVVFDAATRANPKLAIAFFGKGNCLIRINKYQEALDAFDEALKLNPNDKENLSGRGNALFGLKRYEEAAITFESAAKLDPDSAANFYTKAKIMRRLDEEKKSENIFIQNTGL